MGSLGGQAASDTQTNMNELHPKPKTIHKFQEKIFVFGINYTFH
jgi:hypothetical protein